MSKTKGVTRRGALKLAAATAALPLVHIRTAGAAGKLSLGLWDHWVKEADPVLQGIVDVWAEKNKVEVKIDFITSIGNKLLITQAAEAQAKSGHDVLAFDQWNVHQFADHLTPVDQVMTPLIAKYGPVHKAVEYLGKVDGKWMGVPVAWGTAPLPILARISQIKQDTGEDITEWYPAKPGNTPGADAWTYEKQLKLAEICHKAGHTFALGCGSASTDANQAWGATFAAFGAHLMDAKGNITVDTDNMREAMEYVRRIVPFLPSDTISYDDASNNKALLSGRSALIWNPPSAWTVAKRDAPDIAKDMWAFPNPRGKAGRLVPFRPYFWGIWKFAQNTSAAHDLMIYLSQREVVEKLSIPAGGYDIPPFVSMADLPVWAELGPPPGVQYNYPLRPWHNGEYYIPGSSAPPDMATQIWARAVLPSLVARTVQGNSVKDTLDWAKRELEGFRR
jgi:ABC-type glycerol-3-phosphate transport system substrate-binding protein